MFSLNKKLNKNIECFDAIERNWFFTFLCNRNKKGEKIAKEYNKPYIATSDTHNIKKLNKSFALINSESLTMESVFNSIRNKKFENVMNRISWFEFVSYLAWYNYSQLKVLIKGMLGLSSGRINIRIPFISRDSVMMKNIYLIAVVIGLSYFVLLK